MDMQDKEFDALFRSKLDDFEVTPSPMVWDTIDGELNTGSRKRALMPLLSIAASIIVLICAGLLFIPKDVKTGGKPKVKNEVAVIKTHTENIAQAKDKPTLGVLKVSAGSKQQLAQVSVNKPAWPPVIKRESVEIKQAQEIKTEEHPALAAINKPGEIIAVVPDKTTPIAIAPVEENATFITQPAIAATQIPANIKNEATPVKARRRAHTLGDLINLAVAKVDKRKDKFIEFTNTDDDDEANVTGINLGILKIKKDK